MQNTNSDLTQKERQRRKAKRKKQIRQEKIIITFLVLIIITSCLFLLIKVIPLFNKEDAETSVHTDPIINTDESSEITEPENTEEPKIDPKTDGQYIICLDAGHGGSDIGSSSHSRHECDDTLLLTKAIQKELEDLGATVVLTRDSDTKVTQKERSEFANGSNADLCISIHRNKGKGTGVETWIRSDPSDLEQKLGTNIQEAICSQEIQRDRGVKQGTPSDSSNDYKLIRNNQMVTCIAEIGFINSSKDNTLFDENVANYAKAIAKAIDDTYEYYLSLPGEGKDLLGTSKPLETENDTVEALENITTDIDIKEVAEDAEAQTQVKAEGNNSSPSTDNASDAEANNSSDTTNNTTVEPNKTIDLTGLDATAQGWGPGVNFDELNRPAGALTMQQKYNAYPTYFIESDSTDKNIYLTFDEGYENGYTESILDTLKAKNVKATFFITKPYAEQNPKLVQRMIDEGHTVGNHSVNHPSAGLPSESVEEQTNEIMELHNYVQQNFNYTMNLFRFPAGIFSEQSLAIVNNCNYSSVFWSFAYKDYDTANQMATSEALSKLNSRLHPGAIFLLHAVSSTNASILGDFIDDAQASGYTFCNISK